MIARLPVLLALLLWLSGCAQMAALQGDALSVIDQHVERGEYGEAIDIIDALRPSHPDYERARAKLPAISRAADAYAERMIEQARELAAEGQWQPALETYDEALARYSQSRTIAEARESFLADREAYLDDLRTRLLISHGKHLLDDAPVYAEIEHVLPTSYRARRDNAQHQDEIEDTAKRLHTCGMEALGEKRPELAERCLSLAHALVQSQETLEALEQAKRLKASLDTREREIRLRRVEREKSARFKTLMERYRTAMAGQDLLRARDALDEAARLQPDNRELTREQRQLELAIERYVSSEIERGRRAYTLGHIEEALQIWKPLLRYSPDNRRLNEHIERATRVLDNLRAIEQRQPTVPLP